MNSCGHFRPVEPDIVKLPGFLKKLWAKVERRGLSECWPWAGALRVRNFKYGKMTVKLGGITFDFVASRLIFASIHGFLPTKLLVCHTCDNPQCCNPAHLFLGTERDNSDDMIKKGRSVHLRGENNSNAKLTETMVRYIRSNPDRLTLPKLAQKFGVSLALIEKVRQRDLWRHVL
jgi:hypothetical protein